jgi:hypothetical protein
MVIVAPNSLGNLLITDVTHAQWEGAIHEKMASGFAALVTIRKQQSNGLCYEPRKSSLSTKTKGEKQINVLHRYGNPRIG